MSTIASAAGGRALSRRSARSGGLTRASGLGLGIAMSHNAPLAAPRTGVFRM